MRIAALMAALFWAATAAADLYRWVDPETGSVKFSSYPPPWYGDERREKSSPKVEHIPARAPGAKSQPEEAEEPGSKPPAKAAAGPLSKPAAGLPAKPAAAPPGAPSEPPRSPAELRLRPEDDERRPGK
jgi:hypothetical protein